MVKSFKEAKKILDKNNIDYSIESSEYGRPILHYTPPVRAFTRFERFLKRIGHGIQCNGKFEFSGATFFVPVEDYENVLTLKRKMKRELRNVDFIPFKTEEDLIKYHYARFGPPEGDFDEEYLEEHLKICP